MDKLIGNFLIGALIEYQARLIAPIPPSFLGRINPGLLFGEVERQLDISDEIITNLSVDYGIEIEM